MIKEFVEEFMYSCVGDDQNGKPLTRVWFPFGDQKGFRISWLGKNRQGVRQKMIISEMEPDIENLIYYLNKERFYNNVYELESIGYFEIRINIKEKTNG